MFGYIEIVNKYRQRLGDITQEEARAEGFSSLEEFREFWENELGPWDPDLLVWVYEFKLHSGPE